MSAKPLVASAGFAVGWRRGYMRQLRRLFVNYRVVFNIADAGYKSWTFPAFGLIFVATGAVLVVMRRQLPGWWGKPPWRLVSINQKDQSHQTCGC